MIRPPLHEHGGILPWLLGGGLVLGTIVVGGALGFWLYLNLLVGLTLRDQPVLLSLPPTLEVGAEVTNIVEIDLDGVIHAKVPFNQQIEVPFRGEYVLDVVIDAEVPVAFTVTYNGLLPVDTFATINARTTLNFRTLKQFRNLKIQATLPLKMKIPVQLTVPVKDTIHFVYNGPLTVIADQTLTTRVDTVLNTTLAVDQKVSTPIKGRFGLRMHLPQEPVAAIINHSDLVIDPTTLRLKIADETSGPRRRGE